MKSLPELIEYYHSVGSQDPTGDAVREFNKSLYAPLNREHKTPPCTPRAMLHDVKLEEKAIAALRDGAMTPTDLKVILESVKQYRMIPGETALRLIKRITTLEDALDKALAYAESSYEDQRCSSDAMTEPGLDSLRKVLGR